MAPQQNKRILYVGGLTEEVTEEILHAAFIPFGELVEVNIPKDHASKTSDGNRGFAFVEFELEPDADEARFNMDGAELFGRVLRVNVAKALTHKLGSSKPVWSADSWFQNPARTAPRPPRRRDGGMATVSLSWDPASASTSPSPSRSTAKAERSDAHVITRREKPSAPSFSYHATKLSLAELANVDVAVDVDVDGERSWPR
ncbi:peptidyl-prolyl cis-trans isomerase [Aureococcus anophagefferens]|nr:peptidyl-prolyl cis-trans isomerase [Aureococcus anophagefferens]